MDHSPSGFSVREILQARILVCVAVPTGDLLDPGSEPESPAPQADSLPLSHLGSPITQRGSSQNASPTT